jgi:hypothetical protein
MKFFLLMTALFVLSFPALAQEKALGTPVIPAKRLELAEKMHEVWPIRVRVEKALESVSEGFPEEKRAEVKAAMRKSIQFDQLEEESIKAMAEIFTEEELQAMIDFYGSETGRAISAKTQDYELALRPVMIKMVDKAILDVRTGAGD